MSTKWCTIGLIKYDDSFNFLKLPFQFGAGVVFDHVPDWLKKDKFVGQLSLRDEETFWKQTRFALSVEYFSEDFRSPDPNWKGNEQRSIQDANHDAIHFVNIAVWLTKPRAFGLNFIIDIDEFDTEKNVKEVWSVRDVEPHPLNTKDYLQNEDIKDYLQNGDLNGLKDFYLQNDDLIKAKDLHNTLLSLPRNGALWISIRSIGNAIREPLEEIRLLLFWIALEALFSPADGRGIRSKLSKRIGLFLGQNHSDVDALSEKTKKAYRLRSQVVHGLRLSENEQEESFQLSFETQELARKSILKILTTPALIDKFNNEREQFLDQLIFS